MIFFRQRKAAVAERDPTRDYFLTFKDGDKALYLGRPVTVVHADGAWEYDNESWWPSHTIAYWNSAGELKKARLTPREVSAGLCHADN